jgi:hypothetical protein
MKPIHKLNNGRGATLCHTCSVIITTGLTKDLYCEKCKPKQEQDNKLYSESDMTNYALYILHNNVITPKEWLEQFKKK